MSEAMATNNWHIDVPDATYGFIGVGNMGFGMAKNIRAKIPKSSKLVICEINRVRRDEFFARIHGDLEAAETPKELTEKADIIITSLPCGAAVRQVFADPETGILCVSKGSTPKFFLECSTIEVSTSNDVRGKIYASGLGDFVDSPVSGGIDSASKGELSIMVGGTAELYERAKPILRMMGKEQGIFLCGPPGAGLATKQINNYCNFVNYAVLCEGMNAGVRYGLDPNVLAHVINVSSGMSFHTLKRNPVKGVHPSSPAERDFKGGFPHVLAKGVLDMGIRLMDDVGAKQLFGTVMQHVYAQAIKSDKCAGLEHRSVYKLYAEDDGSELGTVVIKQGA